MFNYFTKFKTITQCYKTFNFCNSWKFVRSYTVLKIEKVLGDKMAQIRILHVWDRQTKIDFKKDQNCDPSKIISFSWTQNAKLAKKKFKKY